MLSAEKLSLIKPDRIWPLTTDT